MTQESKELALLAELTRERDQLEETIEGMIADMADLAPEARSSGDWAPDGSQTRRYLELTNRQADLERDIADLTLALAAAAKPGTPN